MNAALDADQADDFRTLYWSAAYLADEADRLHRDYHKLLNRLMLWRCLEADQRGGSVRERTVTRVCRTTPRVEVLESLT